MSENETGLPLSQAAEDLATQVAAAMGQKNPEPQAAPTPETQAVAAEAPPTEEVQPEQEEEVVDELSAYLASMQGQIQALENRIAGLEQAHAQIVKTAADVVNTTVETAMSAAFSRFDQQFSSKWGARLVEVLQKVSEREEGDKQEAEDLAFLRMALPALRQLSAVSDELAQIQQIAAEVKAAKDLILAALGKPTAPAGLFGSISKS